MLNEHRPALGGQAGCLAPRGRTGWGTTSPTIYIFPIGEIGYSMSASGGVTGRAHRMAGAVSSAARTSPFHQFISQAMDDTGEDRVGPGQGGARTYPGWGGLAGRTVAESRSGGPAAPRPPAGGPHIIVVLLDDMGFSHPG